MTNIIAKIAIGLFIATLLAVGYLYTQNEKLRQEVSDKTINIKSLERGITEYMDKDSIRWVQVTELRKTNTELKQSTDSTIIALRNSLASAGIALKHVKGINLTDLKLHRDTTIIVKEVNSTRDAVYDFSRRPHLVNVVTIKGDTASNKFEASTTLTSATVVKKETVDPPKKFFLWRLFQEKHLVVTTHIKSSNPLIPVSGTTQIQVLNNDGTPKKDR